MSLSIFKLIESFSLAPGNNYFRNLKEQLIKKPYGIKLNWNNDLAVLSSSRKISDYSLSEVRECNGLIIDGKTNKPVVYSFNSIQEYNGVHEDYLRENWNQFQVEELIDGAVIRIYYYNDEWNVATLKSIDARNAFWSSKKSFYDLFHEAALTTRSEIIPDIKNINSIGLDDSLLNTDYCYTFIITHPSNHMIVKYDTCSLTHVCTINLKTMKYVEVEVGIPHVKRHVFETFDKFMEVVNDSVELPFVSGSSLGFILTNRQTRDKIKVENPTYLRARELKGNCPNINYRILELLVNDNMNMNKHCNEFLTYFPQYEQNFHNVLAIFEQTSKTFFSMVGNPRHSSRRQLMTRIEKHTIDELDMRAHFDNPNQNKDLTQNEVTEYLRSLSIRRLSFIMNIPYIISRGHRNTRPFIRRPRQYV